MHESLVVVTFYLTWQLAACDFFHDSSAVVLNPGPDSDFGFSLGYYHESLVVGAPHSSRFGFGALFRCPLDFSSSMTCVNIDIDTTKKNYTNELNEGQNFYLGATIATTSDYFITSAPLATMYIEKTHANGKKDYMADAFGSLFLCKNGSYAAYMDKSPIERYQFPPDPKHPDSKDRITGGIGWNSLADEANGFLLLAKTSVNGDINYLNTKHPMENFPVSALDYRPTRDHFSENWNIGYGLAAGKFFSNQTVYAVSMQTQTDMRGQIVFLEAIGDKLRIMQKRNKIAYQISHGVVNAMFGYALGSADINLDGFSELVVGAPTQSDGDFESGALHIYMGGDIESCADIKRMRSIFAEKYMGRFGTAIATGDIDGDNIAEVFVSAPYEEKGVVYILSGYELRTTLVKPGTFKRVWLSELKLTQKIQREGFGFSLLVLPDIDGNGCSDLAVGAPSTSSVAIFRSLQTINVTISLEVVGSQLVKEEDLTFTMSVCLDIGYNTKSTDVTGNIIITNTIDDPGVHMPNPDFNMNLSKDITQYCKNITVELNKLGPGEYTFVTNLKLNKIEDTKEFDTSWAVLSPYSDIKKSRVVHRHCSKVDCNPKLTLDLVSSISDPLYHLGTTDTETVTIVVENSGHVAYSACVRVSVVGAHVLSLDCNIEDGGRYTCLLSEPLKNSANRSIIINLDMKTERSNLDKALIVSVDLYEYCSEAKYTTKSLNKKYTLISEVENVNLTVKNLHDFNVTDLELSNDESTKLNLNQEPLKNTHDYLITNKGAITWNSVKALITVEKSEMIEKIDTAELNCEAADDATHYKISCLLTIQPKSTKEISVSIYYLRKELEKSLGKRPTLQTNSDFVLYLTPTNEIKSTQYVSNINLTVDRGFGNDKTSIIIIAIVVAVVIVIIILVVMVKYGFFKRKEKKKLDSLRSSIRKHSVRRDSERRQSQKASVAGGSGLHDVEEVEDCVFGEVSLTPPTTDEVVLVDAEVEIHAKKCI